MSTMITSTEEDLLLEELQDIEWTMHHGDLREAIQKLEWLAAKYPENYFVMSLLGECYLSDAKPEKAIRPLEWATKVFEKRVKGLRRTSRFAVSKKKKQVSRRGEKALISKLKDWDEAERQKDVWFEHYLLGCAYARCAEFRYAMRHLVMADKLCPGNGEIIRNIGWILCMERQKKIGRELLKKAITLDPNNALAYNDLGASYMFDQNFEEARVWISKAREMDPEDQFIQDTEERLENFLAMKILIEKMPRKQ